MRQRLFVITTALLTVVSLVLGGLYVGELRELRALPDEDRARRYSMLAQRIFLERPGDVLINFQPLRKQVQTYLGDTGLTYSFYFEYLFTGSSIRAGENNKLVGASLMKIPIVMDLYKAAEQGKIKLDDKVTVSFLDNAGGTDATYGNRRHLKQGDKITLREAAKIALAESDNTAAYTIFEATKDLLPAEDQAINNLDIETQVGEANQVKYALIGARSYTSFLKCLYFSCFLTPDHSQEILRELTKGDDNARIRAGVPEGVSVARKIGSFSDITQSDCGIVYLSQRRYALCIMLDADSETADQHIKKLSELVYNYVKNVN